jgi:hypothetical protein
MGACESGYHDANADPGDGCEYECTPAGAELCDSLDNDCDGAIDEDTDLANDPRNCGQCGMVCSAPLHAVADCASGQCTYLCEDGWYDNNGQGADGCEAPECDPTAELCDGHDNDCDGEVDEGFDQTLVDSCGPFCVVCAYQHARASCVAGVCEMGACEAGWHDADGLESTGCEYPCTPTGDEECDSQDNDCDGAVDEDDVCGESCPPDMVAVGFAYCIDRYEASRRDATAGAQGQDVLVALSRPGALPWMVRPMSADHLAEFQAACEAAGKHLCTSDEWFAACTGPEQTTHVYGNEFDRETCNCVDTYCDDYCAEQGIEAELCDNATNCGYTYDCFHQVATGEFPGCTNEYGTLDINGNVWEVVSSDSDPRGYEVRGGAFNCAMPSVRVSCSFNAEWEDLYAGFRCCKAIGA